MESLEVQLTRAIKRYVRLARRNYGFAYTLVVGTILSSALALVPAFSSVAASILKPQGRANWHYRKAGRLIALHRQLSNEHADPANISAEWRSVDAEMDKEWEENFGLDASSVPGVGARPPKSS
jgi:hypothetical protein